MKKDYPLITIITATYKKFDKLYETMRSVFLQNYPNIELVICDDGSDNFPEEKINSFIEKNKRSNVVSVKVLHSEQNHGTVKNLNNAYKKSSGKYIVNLSCGDVFFETDTVSKITQRFMKTDCRVLVTSRVLYRDKYNYIYMLPHYTERRIIKRFDDNKKQYAAFTAGRYYDMASGSAMYFSRDIIEEIGYFDERYILWEDGPFLAKYLYKYPLEFAYDIVSIWYEDGGVSAKGGSLHPLLKKDIDMFNNGERVAHVKELSKRDRARMVYMKKSRENKSALEKIRNYIIYFPEVSFYVTMNYIRRFRVKKDKQIIERLLIDNKDKIIGYYDK